MTSDSLQVRVTRGSCSAAMAHFEKTLQSPAHTTSNRDGIGAVVHVTAAGAKQWQMLRSGSSYLSQSELVLTFGLGTATKADALEIHWPSGQVDKLASIAADQTVTVQEGKGVIANQAYGKPQKAERTSHSAKSSRLPQ